MPKLIGHWVVRAILCVRSQCCALYILWAPLQVLMPDSSFNPRRAPLIVPKSGWKGLKVGPHGKHAANPAANVVCKCEKVTEAEVVAACHRSDHAHTVHAAPPPVLCVAGRSYD